MKTDHKFINTVPEDEAQTHLHVPQTAVVVPFRSHVGVIYDLLSAAITIQDYKVLVFFPTARHTQVGAVCVFCVSSVCLVRAVCAVCAAYVCAVC